MPLINKVFNGKLNLDDDPYRVGEGDYIDALNITRDAQGKGQDVVVSNMMGNTQFPFDLYTGINKCIGKKEDKVRNRIYFFVWNSNNYHFIIFYDRTNDVMVKVIKNLTDTGGVDVLKFNPSFRINHVDLIYRDEGDIISWTDGSVTPREFNVQFILNGKYSVIKTNFIEAAKRPTLSPPICKYGSDNTRNANSLRRTLFQFTSRLVYDTFQKSTFSTYSKIPLPIGYYGSDNDISSTSNNFITVTVETGDENVSFIEIAMRSNIGDAWSDFTLVASLDKTLLNIPNNSTYSFLFYNDGLYPEIIDGVEYVSGVQVLPLFSYVPLLAKTQALPNGNVKSYAAITEGYNNYPVNKLNVTITAANVTNVPPDATPAAITYVTYSLNFQFTVSGTVGVGTRYRIYIYFNGTGAQTNGVYLVGDYTAVFGDTTSTVANALYAQFAAFPSNPSIYVTVGGSIFVANFGVVGSYVFSINIQPASGGGTISTEKTWLWDCSYIFGLVYVDEQNRDMPGVTTYSNPVSTDNDFVVTTPSFSQSSGNAQTPVISASINHLPPAGAVKYYWVRRRQNYGSFLFYETCDVQSDSNYYYFCLANIDKYKAANTQFIYGTAPITSESRIKIVAGVTTGNYNANTWTQDYQIVGTVIKTLTGGSSPADDVTFIKVKKPIGAVSPAYTANMVVMIYTPQANPTGADAVYWEWGEAYDIYTLNGVNYHKGKDQNQTNSQPATFTFPEGDVYFHVRTMYATIPSGSPPTQNTLSIMDANFSDFFDSAVNDNGRAQAIEVNARQSYFPTLIRFSGAYESGTNVNLNNIFYAEDFDEYDRTFGDIRKLFINKRYLYVFQRFNTGVVPILTQIVKDVSGNPLEANSDILLNKITYPYQQQFGIGDVPESFAFAKGAMYGVDNNKGVVWRLSQDGQQPLSIIYKTNAFFTLYLQPYKQELNNGYPDPVTGIYTGDPKVNGVFNGYTNKYILALEEVNRYDANGLLIQHQDAYTISFNETRDASEGFESFFSYKPEMQACLDNFMVTWKDGQMWKHQPDTFLNFYGYNYDAYITPIFRSPDLQKKTFISIGEQASMIWDCPEITTNVESYDGTFQNSIIYPAHFKKLEGMWHAPFFRDINSKKGLYNGDTLKGTYIIVKFRINNVATFQYLNIVSLKFIDSPLTTK